MPDPDVDRFVAALDMHLAGLDGPVRWTQHHVGAPYGPGDAPDGAEMLTGWVDVHLLDGGDRTAGRNWSVTVAGTFFDVFDGVADDVRPDDCRPWAELDVTVDGVDRRLAVARAGLDRLYLEPDRTVHRLTGVGRLDPELESRLDAVGGRRHGDEVAVTTAAGALPDRAAFSALSAIAGTADRAVYTVGDGWSTPLLSAAVSGWLHALTGRQVGCVYVPPGVAEATDGPTPLIARLRRQAAELDAADDADDRDWSDPSRRWLTIPACGHRWLPADALHGERPQTCVAPAVALADPGSGPAPHVPPRPVETTATHPGGVPVCATHLPVYEQTGWTLRRRPG